MPVIALATAADLAALLALDPIARRSADRRDAIAEWVAAGQCHVAHLDGAPAGYVALTRTFFRSPFIEMLMIAESARRRGLGRALIQHCITLCPSGEKLWTSTNESNTPMRALLPTLGFAHTGQFEGLDEGDPELIYLRGGGSLG
jgi:GNAT superfamily N-acetyltransferase